MSAGPDSITAITAADGSARCVPPKTLLETAHVSGTGGAIIRAIIPGAMLAILIAAMSLSIETRLGGPVMLYALLGGALCNPLSARAGLEHRLRPGLDFSADTLLKVGVALLAVKITLVDVANLGWQTAAMVFAGVAATLVIGTAIGRLFGLKLDHSVLSAGSVAICGSSAALAIASVLPCNKKNECNTVVTVIAVTSLSTLAMVAYPLLASALNFTDTQSGIFMGISIHNVAQVVGAGYIVSGPAGEIATIVKLMRVACLLPVIVILSMIFRTRNAPNNASGSTAKKPPLLPIFMVAFILIMLINSAGLIPALISSGFTHVSQWALVIAVAALGVKTSVRDIVGVGIKPLLALVSQTAFLAVFAILMISAVVAA